MMVYERSESARDNFGKFIDQFQPETKILIRKLERILIKFYWQNLSLLFNQTYLNEKLLPNNNTHTHTQRHTYINIYIYKIIETKLLLSFNVTIINNMISFVQTIFGIYIYIYTKRLVKHK